MSVELEPAELGFRRPFNHEVAEVLRLHNPNSDPVAFKVKTTAPKQYCVRPNSGRIEVGGTVEVQVLLQAMKEDPPLEAKCRDKFLVQSVGISADKDSENVSAIWSSIEGTAKSSINEKKIRVNFLPADGSFATPARKSLGPIADDEPHSYGSPASTMATPVGAVSKPESKPNGASNLGETVRSAGNPASQPQQQQTVSSTIAGAASSAAASTAAVASTSADELRAQLTEAKAQIARLTAQAADQAGLRQRKPESSAEKSGPTATAQAVQAVPAGVPVPLVAALCLLSFLLAYLLF